jgi:hypothetical protein
MSIEAKKAKFNINDWVTGYIAKVKQLSKQTDTQKKLIALHDKAEKTVKETQIYTDLAKAERLLERAAQAQAKAVSCLKDEEKRKAEVERKARTHELINLGGLVAKAGLDAWDTDTLMGALLSLATVQDQQKKQHWKVKGQEALKS